MTRPSIRLPAPDSRPEREQISILERFSHWTSERPHFREASLIVLYVVVCLIALPNIPANWDELANRKNGEAGLQVAADYLSTGEPAEPLFGYEHGTAFEMLLIGVEKALGVDLETNPVGSLRVRHASIYAIFCCALVVFYLSATDLFSSRLAGMLAVTLLALHPRIFHHAFHNSSDIGFLAFGVLWFWTLERLCRMPTVPSAFLHATICALAIDTRVVGVFFLCVSIFIVAANIIAKRGTEGYARKAILATFSFLGFSTLLVVLFWPFLWGRPVGNLLWAVSQFAAIETPFGIRYMGRMILSTEVPWHYNFVWFSITTPWYVVAGFVVGVISVLSLVSSRAQLVFAKEGLGMAIGLWILIPVLAPIALGSTLFNGWRHHFFVYPAIVLVTTHGLLVALRGVRRLWPRIAETTLRSALTICVVTHLALVLWTLHPYQNLYFSSPLSRVFGPQRGFEHKFEVDYWCTSYRQGLSFLAASIAGPIRVHGHWKPLWMNRLFLAPGDQDRIQIVRDVREADFHLGVFRQTGSGGYPSHFGKEVFAANVDEIQVLSVRMLRNPPFGRGPMESVLPEAPRDVRKLIHRRFGTDG